MKSNKEAPQAQIRLIEPAPFYVFIVTCTDCGFITTGRMGSPSIPFIINCKACGATIEIDPRNMGHDELQG